MKDIYENPENFKPIKEYLKSERLKTNLTINEIGKIYNKYYGLKDVKDNRRIVGHYFKNSQWCLPTKEIYENVLQKTGCFKKPYKELKEEYNKLRQQYELLRYSFNQPYVQFKGTTIEQQKEIIKPFSTVWEYERDDNIVKLHITPKPLEMIKHIINTSSNENDIVLDCFSGSGTLAEACEELNRKWICIEKEQKYCDVTVERINKLHNTNL